jgi:T5SS/PEP-CTERM-associated repeat protein
MSNTLTITYAGHGHAGNWSDPLNWAGGVVPGAANTAVFNTSATLNGLIEVNNLMLLGTETITVNGQVKTDNTNVCQSFMACEGAAITFTPGSSLLDAGGFITGIDAGANVTVDGAAGTSAAATITCTNLKLGQADDGSGTLTVAGVVNNSGATYVGLEGQGVLNISGNGQCNLTGLTLGYEAGANGQLNLTGNAEVDVSGWAVIGTSVANAPGGNGTVTLGTGTSFFADHGFYVSDNSAVHLQGGTLLAGPDSVGLQVRAGGTVSGNGTITATAKSVMDNGTITATGGTLSITGNVNGIGVLQIGASSTLDITASRITLPAIAFVGADATLQLTTGITGTFAIAGFAAGDSLVMANISSLNWNGTADVLTLYENKHAVDRFTMTGVPANATFALSASTGGSVITMTAPTPGFIATHH